MYTIQKLAMLSGVSTRTLRYYDEIGLLEPASVNESGYRVYGGAEVDRLQQILFYRAMGFKLSQIQQIIEDPSYNRISALYGHLEVLKERQRELSCLIHNVEKTILKEEGKTNMTDVEKFEGLKKQIVAENEEKYGDEIRTKYGDQAVDESNQKLLHLSKEAYQKMQEIEAEIQSRLEAAVQNGESPAGEEGKAIALLHKQWLMYTWKSYQKEAHAGVVRMYVEDGRFCEYYDKNVAGCAQFLRDAVLEILGC